jgi:hypothetical protein
MLGLARIASPLTAMLWLSTITDKMAIPKRSTMIKPKADVPINFLP